MVSINTAFQICGGLETIRACEDEEDRREIEHERRENRIAEIFAAVPKMYGSALILETVSELGASDPQFDEACFDLYVQATTTQTRQDYHALGVAFAGWINHYRRQVAEREVDRGEA